MARDNYALKPGFTKANLEDFYANANGQCPDGYRPVSDPNTSWPICVRTTSLGSSGGSSGGGGSDGASTGNCPWYKRIFGACPSGGGSSGGSSGEGDDPDCEYWGTCSETSSNPVEQCLATGGSRSECQSCIDDGGTWHGYGGGVGGFCDGAGSTSINPRDWTRQSCQQAGGAWNGFSCDFDDELACSFNQGYWYDNDCHATPKTADPVPCNYPYYTDATGTCVINWYVYCPSIGQYVNQTGTGCQAESNTDDDQDDGECSFLDIIFGTCRKQEQGRDTESTCNAKGYPHVWYESSGCTADPDFYCSIHPNDINCKSTVPSAAEAACYARSDGIWITNLNRCANNNEVLAYCRQAQYTGFLPTGAETGECYGNEDGRDAHGCLSGSSYVNELGACTFFPNQECERLAGPGSFYDRSSLSCSRPRTSVANETECAKQLGYWISNISGTQCARTLNEADSYCTANGYSYYQAGRCVNETSSVVRDPQNVRGDTGSVVIPQPVDDSSCGSTNFFKKIWNKIRDKC